MGLHSIYILQNPINHFLVTRLGICMSRVCVVRCILIMQRTGNSRARDTHLHLARRRHIYCVASPRRCLVLVAWLLYTWVSCVRKPGGCSGHVTEMGTLGCMCVSGSPKPPNQYQFYQS